MTALKICPYCRTRPGVRSCGGGFEFWACGPCQAAVDHLIDAMKAMR